MRLFYLDSSAIFKRYRRESGTEVVDQILDGPRAGDRFYISFLSALEVTAVVLRLSKGGQLATTIGNQVLADFRQDLGRLFDVWPLDQAVAAAAVRTIERYTLKAPDAIHLTTALAINWANPSANCILVTSDVDLLRAADDAGLHTLNPQEPDADRTLTALRATLP